MLSGRRGPLQALPPGPVGSQLLGNVLPTNQDSPASHTQLHQTRTMESLLGREDSLTFLLSSQWLKMVVSPEVRRVGWLVPTSDRKLWLKHQSHPGALVPRHLSQLVPVCRSASSHTESYLGQVPGTERHSGNASGINAGISLHAQQRMLCTYCWVPLDKPFNLAVGGADDSLSQKAAVRRKWLTLAISWCKARTTNVSGGYLTLECARGKSEGCPGLTSTSHSRALGHSSA